MERDEDFKALERLIQGFEHLADFDRLDDETYKKFQALLDRFAEKYQLDEAAGARRFMLYEMQALLHHVKGDFEKAEEFLHAAKVMMANDMNFVSKSARQWATEN
ncbi:MAG TPA: hypothetical protein VLG47_05295 [Candidatus Saccharimonadales bacterium]|nr:hypothetical protein [Candidatus Saccharimonadales bacterium]